MKSIINFQTFNDDFKTINYCYVTKITYILGKNSEYFI